MNFKKVLLGTVAGLGLAGASLLSQTHAAHAETTTWTPRTVEEIKADLQSDGSYEKYTIKWGDTLSAISLATEVPVDKLAAVNTIHNVDLIHVDTVLYFSADHKVVTVQTETQTTSYNVETAEEVETPAEVATPAPTLAAAATPNNGEGYWLTVEATAYSYNEAGLSYFTANGTDLRNNPNVIAVDPSVIPLGSTVYIPGYGTYTAADTGGAIVGNRIDVHMVDLSAMTQFGRRQIQIQVLN